ncbi:dTDP-4-amino-4,6-dideoxygalactose transaminase [Chitinophaga jiangningensis]|uniref:dTDP-4-amino-4,6-dideoxygalactose transaminase n=1 Tax=Chitinophaga jiangningensis TaxID=1419482 RepID=A0A1M7HJ05_9BACT|nr:DegT/DnrJ/EryC1/StrS family aminotransferase [Chitinophaga jiangningensis]SHM28429.1 dTDP-4-amino-4,6-dideoxygalactose transaminase [Chitinophaga jiangningensis]
MVPLFKPYMSKNISQLNEILYSGALSYGKWGRQFESELSNMIGHPQILAVNSYNIAILVVLSALDLQPGDEIIASPVSCLASNQPFITKRLKIIWTDVDPNTGTLDPADVRSKITGKTKVIMHNHFCGYPGYINEINAIGKEFGITVIDDCIEAFGSSYNGRLLGNCDTDISIFSFQPVRLPNTIDGGAISFKNKTLYEKAAIIRDYGINRSQFRDSMNEISPNCDIALEGYGALMSDVNAYIGVSQMPELLQLLSKQRSNAEQWKENLSERYPDMRMLGNRKEINPNYWVFSVLSKDKDQLMKSFREEGFYASGVHINNNIYSAFGQQEELKGVKEFMSTHLALPCGWWMNQ